MISLKHQGWMGETEAAARPLLLMSVAGAMIVLLLAMASTSIAADLPLLYFLKQDAPILSAMVGAAILFPHLRFDRRWKRELHVSRVRALGLAGMLVVFCLLGHHVLLLGYDLSRDESMATFAADQIGGSAALVTQVPGEWAPYGHAMMPIFLHGAIDPNLAWASGYSPFNSAIRALAGLFGDQSLAGPVMLLIGLGALWTVARRLWPERPDAAVIALLLAATSSQLLVTAMTAYAMTGYFALNMVWMALFLRGDKWGVSGALTVGFLATGLHQIHFHPMFVAPFLLWLVMRREWRMAAVYGIGYAAIGLFWWRIYPDWVVHLADVPAVTNLGAADFGEHVLGRIRRLFQYPIGLTFLNFARFAAWQNILLLPLACAAAPLARRAKFGDASPLLPLLGACGIGLLLMVHQGHGWGYRYLHGLIGAFCLLAGYGWCRLVPQAGPSRAWALVKCACCLALLVVLPAQLLMARALVAPYARLHSAVASAPADVVLVDIFGGYYAQDIIQNGPDFSRRPLAMDLSLVPIPALAELCKTKRVLLVDRRHYRAVGMRELPIALTAYEAIEPRRALLSRLGCAPPLPL